MNPLGLGVFMHDRGAPDRYKARINLYVGDVKGVNPSDPKGVRTRTPPSRAARPRWQYPALLVAKACPRRSGGPPAITGYVHARHRGPGRARASHLCERTILHGEG